MLALAAGKLQTAEMTTAERDALDIFQQRLAKLEALQTEREELGRLYREQQFGVKAIAAILGVTMEELTKGNDQP